MKPCIPDCSLATQTLSLYRRSADFCAMALSNNRVAPRGHKNPFGEICAPACFAALLLACITLPTAQADNLGRLFFTPAQRKQLDYTYVRNATEEGSTSPILTVNGIVQKHGGARTVWINGVAQSADNSGERTATAQTVTVPGSRPLRIKVGQKILLNQTVQTRPEASDE